MKQKDYKNHNIILQKRETWKDHTEIIGLAAREARVTALLAYGISRFMSLSRFVAVAHYEPYPASLTGRWSQNYRKNECLKELWLRFGLYN